MIVYSDNYATHLLNLNLNINDFKKLFVEAGLPEPNVFDPNYEITTAGYSRFMRILYNSSYLSKDNSEYALTLLCQSKFKDGLLKNIPDNIEVAHKFGESATGPRNNQVNQLHESGIFYCNDHPYLLTVMTKGKNVKTLPDVLSQISSEVYHSIQ
jgi:beta-lactamase class A